MFRDTDRSPRARFAARFCFFPGEISFLATRRAAGSRESRQIIIHNQIAAAKIVATTRGPIGYHRFKGRAHLVDVLRPQSV